MEKVVLSAQIRDEKGKSLVKKVRREGLVPAVCYKDGKESFGIKVKVKELIQALHTKAGENVLISLQLEGDKKDKERIVIIKEIQHEPINNEIIHVDFNEISLTKKLNVNVPIATHGEPKEIAKDGGVLEHIIWEVEVECLPLSIPDKIQVDVTTMKVGDAIHIKDLKAGEGVTILGDPDAVVLIAKMPDKEEAVEGEVAEGEQEPEVIAKGKKPEEGEEGEAEAPSAGKPAAGKKE